MLLRLLQVMDQLVSWRLRSSTSSPKQSIRKGKHGPLHDQIMVVVNLSAPCLEPTPQSCTFYQDCLEVAHPCGSDGYAIDYGQYYCDRFSKKFGKVGGNLQAWMWATLHCLQVALVPLLQTATSMGCGDITTYGFATHASCYTDNGVQSVCDLSLGDLIRIATVPDLHDLLSVMGFEQMAEVLRTCLPRWLPFPF